MGNSWEWVQKYRKKLQDKYDDKTIIVCDNKVVKVLDGAVNPIEVNKIANSLCRSKDWSYTYICREEEYLL